MRDKLAEIELVMFHSLKTQVALIIGVIGFVIILIYGHYQLADFKLFGPMESVTDIIKYNLSKRYEKIAFIFLISFLAIALRNYQKDKKQLLGS